VRSRVFRNIHPCASLSRRECWMTPLGSRPQLSSARTALSATRATAVVGRGGVPWEVLKRPGVQWVQQHRHPSQPASPPAASGPATAQSVEPKAARKSNRRPSTASCRRTSFSTITATCCWPALPSASVGRGDWPSLLRAPLLEKPTRTSLIPNPQTKTTRSPAGTSLLHVRRGAKQLIRQPFATLTPSTAPLT